MVLPSEIGILKFLKSTTGVPNITVGGITALTPAETSAEAISTWVMGQTAETYRASKVVEYGEYKLTINYDPATAAHADLRAAVAGGNEYRYGLCYDGTNIAETFNALVTNFAPSELTKGNNVMAEVTLKVTGAIEIAEEE